MGERAFTNYFFCRRQQYSITENIGKVSTTFTKGRHSHFGLVLRTVHLAFLLPAVAYYQAAAHQKNCKW